MSLKQFTLVFILTVTLPSSLLSDDLRSIMKAHEEKVDKARKIYDANIEKAKKITIKRLENLKKSTMRSGKLKDAIKIQEEIEILQGKTEKDKNEIDINAGVPVPPGENQPKFIERQTQAKLRKRFIEFHNLLIADKQEQAMEFLDPSLLKQNNEQIIKGHLKILAGILKAFQVKKNGIDIEKVKFTTKLKEAKITSKTRAINGEWRKNNDPSYWIFKKGEWYLGDKADIRKLF